MKGLASTRVQIGVTVAFAILLTGGLATGTALLRSHPGCQVVVIASSQEKAAMLAGFAATYNTTAQVAGHCVDVKVEEVFSGDAEQALTDGWAGQTLPRPDVWSPASRSWVNLLEEDLAPNARQVLPDPGSYDSLFESPLVIGMPAPMAQELDYPARAIGWADIFNLAKDPGFRLGKTNPTVSTSGLHALIGTYVVACPNNLTSECVDSDATRKFVGQIEGSVVHYGQTATEFLANMLNADALRNVPYVSAIALEEKELADYNAGIVGTSRNPPPREPLVAVYPKDGTPIADHPYVVLRWATPLAQIAAQGFETFLKQAPQMAIIAAANFRDSEGRANPTLAKLSAGNQPLHGWITAPTGSVLRAMLRSWQKLRKPARVLILIDSAVDGTALAKAIKNLKDAVSGVSGFHTQDKVGIAVFPAAGGATPYQTIRSVGPVDASLPGSLDGVQKVNAPPALEVALQAAVKDMAAFYDPAAINAVLVLELSPSSEIPSGPMISILSSQPADHFVHVFTVGPPSSYLAVLARSGGGASYDPGSASHYLSDAISNF